MYVPNFVIPLNREDLCQPTDEGHFYVRNVLPPRELQNSLDAAKAALTDEGPSFIVDHFETFYSLVQHFKQTTDLNRQRAWSIINKAVAENIGNLNIVLDDVKNVENEVRDDMRNITKMIFYIVTELLMSFQDKHCDQSNKLNVLADAKNKKKPKPSDDGWDWIEEKCKILNEMYTFLRLPIKMLWDPPVPEDEFVNLIANCCYKCLEDPNIAHNNSKSLRENIFQVFSVLIKNYLHGLSFCVKTMQLLKTHDHLVNTLVRGTVQLVTEWKCSNLTKEIIREITDIDNDQLAMDASGTRSINQFLVQLAEQIPESVFPAIDLLTNHLSGESYTMRNCVLEVFGEIVSTILCREDLSEDLRKRRDEFLDCLEDHVHDVNAFVRSKVLQIWQRLCSSKSIPVSRLNNLLNLAIGRLADKSTNVKKHAIHLIKNLLETNPYSAQLNIVEIRSQLKEETEKLDSLKKSHKLDVSDADSGWKSIESKVRDIVENREEMRRAPRAAIEDRDELDVEEKIDEIGNHLMAGNVDAAVGELENFKDRCRRVLRFEKDDDVDVAELLKNIFYLKMKASAANVPFEVRERLSKCEATIEYLTNALDFAELIDLALPVILTLLDSNVVTDVLESIHFFTAAHLFGFHRAVEGVRKMLHLIYSKDDVVRSAISESYKNLYFEQGVEGRHRSVATVKNLSDLILKLNESQLDALEYIVRDWYKEGLIDSDFVQVAFERFSKKAVGIGDDYSWAALVLIRMVGAEEPLVVKSNISVLLSQGLGNAETRNFLIARETCKALTRLMPERRPGKAADDTLRYSVDHEIFVFLREFVGDSLWRNGDPHYLPMADEAVNLIFQLCDQPDVFCEKLIADVHDKISKNVDPLKRKKGKKGNVPNRGDAAEAEDAERAAEEEEKAEETQEEVREREILILSRFISLLGQIAANYVYFLEGPILNELKHRNQLDFEKKLKKLEEKSKCKSKKNPKLADNSMGDRSNKMDDGGGEDLEFNRVAADDMEAEELKRKAESEIVTGNGYFAKFVPLVVSICKNPGKFNSNKLQNAALLTLSKFMLASSAFCERHLQLLVTICEKSRCPQRRKNAVIALGALQYRFPNTLEPWTPHMYGMLKDSDSSVRLAAVTVLTDLIVNEMIKVRSNIADLAACIVDSDVRIANTVRHFFREYSLKGNSLFNVLPCLISILMQPESRLEEDEFKSIMKFILGLFTKDKQSEYLIDKLFQYFESATTEKQWKCVAYCLSLLNYNDKALRKILDNLRYFGNKLYLADVYEAFCVIVANAGKNPQKDKSLLKEIQDLVKECRDRSCRDKNENFATPHAGKALASLGKRPTTRKARVAASGKKETCFDGKKSTAKCKRQIKYEDAEGEEEEEVDDDDDDDDDDAFLSDSSVRKCLRSRNGKNSKVIEAMDCSSDSDSQYPRKQAKKSKSRGRAKRAKGKCKYSDDSSDEEKKEKAARKRK